MQKAFLKFAVFTHIAFVGIEEVITPWRSRPSGGIGEHAERIPLSATAVQVSALTLWSAAQRVRVGDGNRGSVSFAKRSGANVG